MGYNVQIEHAIGRIPAHDANGSKIDAYLLDKLYFEGLQYGIVGTSHIESPLNSKESLTGLCVLRIEGDLDSGNARMTWVEEPQMAAVLEYFVANIDAPADREYILAYTGNEEE